MMGSLLSELMFVRMDMSLVPGLIGLCTLDGMPKCFYACFGGFFSFLIRVLTDFLCLFLLLLLFDLDSLFVVCN